MAMIITSVICFLVLQLHEAATEPAECALLRNIIQGCDCEGAGDDPLSPVIYCRYKGLTEVPAINGSFNGTIYEFTLSNNKITVLPEDAFQGLRIQQLDITDNPLTNISEFAFRGLEADLQVLKIAGDKDSDVLPPFPAIGQLTNLKGLTMKKFKVPSNDLNGRNFLPFSKLESLHLDLWGLQSIENDVFDGLSQVKRLVLTKHNMISLPLGAMQLMKQLTHFDISQNSIKMVPFYAFSTFSKLTSLNLQSNSIAQLEESCFEGIKDKLVYLDLSYNPIQISNLSRLSDLSVIKNLNLASIRLATIPHNAEFLQHKMKLQYLNLGQNSLTNIADNTFASLPELISLDLSHNSIDSMADGALTNLSKLEYLLLDRQNLATGKTMKLPSFEKMEMLKTITLTKTKLDSGTIWDNIGQVTNLESLDIAETGITSIKDFAFQKMRNLGHLDLSRNKISFVNQKKFVGPRYHLKTLYLANNNITTLDHCTFFNYNNSLKISLLSNQLHCDCKLRWLRSALREKTISFVTGLEKCSSPHDKANKMFTSFNSSEFVCATNYIEPQCDDYYTTTIIPTTTTTATIPTTLPRTTIQVVVTTTTQASITVTWTIDNKAHITDLYVIHQELNSDKAMVSSKSLPTSLELYEIRGLKPGVKYEICVKAKRTDSIIDQECVQAPTKDIFKTTTDGTTGSPASQDGYEIGIIIGAVIGGVILLAILIAILYLMFVRRTPKKEGYPVQPRTFTQAELPVIGYDSKRYRRKKKDTDKDGKEQDNDIKVTVISDGKTGKNVGRISAGSYQYIDPKTNQPVTFDPDPTKQPAHTYINENNQKNKESSDSNYANSNDDRKLPKVPPVFRPHHHGYYNPAFKTEDQQPHDYYEIKL